MGIEEATELHKQIKRKFKRCRAMVFNIDDIWSADLDTSKEKLSEENKGYKYLLNVINVFSKYAYSIPFKSKSSDFIIEAFNKLFKFDNRKPNKLWTDRGSEFVNHKFKNFLKSHKNKLYHTFNEGKVVVVQRFNRTLGEMIQKHMTANKTTKDINVLQKLIDEYNNKNHSSIKLSPHAASKSENMWLIIQNLYGNVKQDIRKRKFKIGDRVRIYKYRTLFKKVISQTGLKKCL